MGATRSIHFFATPADLEPGFHRIERQQQVTLAEHRYYDSKSIPVVSSLSNIPNLGKIAGRRSPCYVVQPAGKRFSPDRVVQIGKAKDFSRKLAMPLAMMGICPPGGKVVYDIYLGSHPLGIMFAPGGFYDPQTLIAGEVASFCDTKASVELYELFCNELLKGFTSVQSCEVGPEALDLLKSGGRLTVDVQAAAMLDLVLA